jgi:DNA end-binding protein Ku
VQEALDRKVAGGQFAVSAPAKKGGEIVDLMEALRASLGKPRKAPAPKAAPSARGSSAERKPPRSALRAAETRAASSRK